MPRSFLLCILLLLSDSAIAQTTQVIANEDRGVSVFALGDWGLNSPHRQAVADQMAKEAGAANPEAALLLGDNFYIKLTDVDDPKIQSFFEKTYDNTKLAIPFYAVMGNHDYKEHNDDIELAYAAKGNTRLKIPARWYRLDLP